MTTKRTREIKDFDFHVERLISTAPTRTITDPEILERLARILDEADRRRKQEQARASHDD